MAYSKIYLMTKEGTAELRARQACIVTAAAVPSDDLWYESDFRHNGRWATDVSASPSERNHRKLPDYTGRLKRDRPLNRF